MRPKVVKIDINNKVYGGRIYENEIIRLLENNIEFERVFIMKHEIRFLNIFRLIAILLKYKFFFSGTLLLTNATTFFAGLRSRNIVVVHHIDAKFSFSPTIIFDWYCNHYLYAHKRRFDKVVVVAEVWRQALERSGFKNVIKIYNSFNPQDYIISNEKILAFKTKYGLLNKPIIYLGNCLKRKGILQCYDCLKDLDVFLVTSGNKDTEVNTIHLDLPYSEYRLLLASADVVLTMSLFLEGWSRVAHEASLCGTTVIGSGTGGMKELLEMAGQKISDFTHLKDDVINALNVKYTLTEEIKSLDLQYFQTEWLKVFSE